MVEQQFINKVFDRFQQEFDADPGDHKHVWEMINWVGAYFLAEEMGDCTNKDLARWIVAGIPSFKTEQDAYVWLGSQYENIKHDDTDTEDEQYQGFIERLDGFFNPPSNFWTQTKDE